jgi:hypothetical protein
MMYKMIPFAYRSCTGQAGGVPSGSLNASHTDFLLDIEMAARGA